MGSLVHAFMIGLHGVYMPRRVGEVSFRILGVEGSAVDPAARRAAQYHRNWRSPAEVRLGQQVGDLVEGATDEVHELKFSHRTHAGQRRAKAGVDDGHLGDGRVDDARRAEAVDQAFCDLEGSAINANVFADAEDGGIAFHLFPNALADCFEIGDGCHVLFLRSNEFTTETRRTRSWFHSLYSDLKSVI